MKIKPVHIIYTFATLLEVAACVGIYALDYFARAKLGMNRWLVYHNQTWEESLPLGVLGVVASLLVVALFVLALVHLLRSPQKRLVLVLSCLLSGVLCVGVVVFALRYSPETTHAYYLMLLLLWIACVIQVGKSLYMSFVSQNSCTSKHGCLLNTDTLRPMKGVGVNETSEECKAERASALQDANDQAQTGSKELHTADETEAKVKRTKRIMRIATVAVLAIFIVVCLVVPSVRSEMGTIFGLLSSGDISAVAELIRSYGAWAAVVSFFLMVLQSLAAPIPAFLITFANAAVFGWWQGAILSWSSAMVGAAVCFYIARILGRDAVAHFVTKGALASIDKFFERYGKNAILICRLLPFMSFDYVSYAAGLTGMSFLDFFVATGVGQLPATIIYSYVGGMLTGSAQLFVTALLIIFALFALVFLIRQVFKARHSDLMDENTAA